MAKRKSTKKKKKKQPQGGAGQSFAVFVSGCLVALCLVSVAYGFLARRAGAERVGAPFRIEVLNGTGQAGLANKVAATMRRRGIDVFRVENADHFDYAETILLTRRSGIDTGALAREVGCPNVVEQLKREAFVDASLIIGGDYEELRIGAQADSGLLE